MNACNKEVLRDVAVAVCADVIRIIVHHTWHLLTYRQNDVVASKVLQLVRRSAGTTVDWSVKVWHAGIHNKLVVHSFNFKLVAFHFTPHLPVWRPQLASSPWPY